MSTKEIEAAADSIAKKDVGTSCKTLDKLFEDSYRNTHKDASGNIDSAKDWQEYYKKELMTLTQKLVENKLLPSISTGDSPDNQLKVQGTFKTANEEFLVIADGQSGANHEVYLQDKDGKFMRGQLNADQSSGKFSYDTTKRFDSIEAARSAQQGAPPEQPRDIPPEQPMTTPPELPTFAPLVMPELPIVAPPPPGGEVAPPVMPPFVGPQEPPKK